MPEYFDKTTSPLREEALGNVGRHHYPPPRDVNQYVSRALPRPPTRPRSVCPSSQELEETHSRQHTPEHLIGNGVVNDQKHLTFHGKADEDVSAMVELPEILIPEDFDSSEDPPLVSPRPQRPDSKLLLMWANGDDLVSPITIEATAETSWVNHIVSPLSEDLESWVSPTAGSASLGHEPWLDVASSDSDEEMDSPTLARDWNRISQSAISKATHTQATKRKHRDSDSGDLTPIPNWDIGKSTQDADGPNNVYECENTQTPIPSPSMYSRDVHSYTQDRDIFIDEPQRTSAVYRNGTLFSSRPRGGHIKLPPPLLIAEQGKAPEEYVKTPFPLQDIVQENNERSPQSPQSSQSPQSPKLRERRSGLRRFSSLRRTPSQSIRMPPPGFTEIVSQIDYEGTVSPVPRVKNMLSKAKHGLGIVRVGSMKETRRSEV
ncbi:hypothetical protein F4808DRAFT_385600 [Astrocystis sublimbata]|nr:hypothetical protein F4808DRAFT_385600 [Astrocystis sublimbata]